MYGTSYLYSGQYSGYGYNYNQYNPGYYSGGHYPGHYPGHYRGTAYPEFDRNGDGRITESDYILAARERGLGLPGEIAYRAAFRALDVDGNGVLDNNEASRGFRLSHHLMNRY